MKTIIHENMKGLLFKNGRFQRLLGAGKYRTWGGKVIETVALDAPLESAYCSLEVLLADPVIAAKTVTVEVGEQQLALHYADGLFCHALTAGKYAFWREGKNHEFRIVDVSRPEADPDLPVHLFSKLPGALYTKVEVAPHQKAMLFVDCKPVRLLDAGVYHFWNNDVSVEVKKADVRLCSMTVSGQELLTKDKVTLRITFVCSFRVTDPEKALTLVDDYVSQLYVAVQLALREYVGSYRLDEILENKEEISRYVLEKLAAKREELFVEITEAGVKDIILPGEIREIMNTVLAAEKRAQANVITRREEVASTRSLLNTAKMMEENPTLYRLKELEYLERICENVGNLQINGSGDLLTQLTALFRSGAT